MNGKNMNTFKQYRRNKKPHVLDPVFGSHSDNKPDTTIVVSDEDLSESTIDEQHAALHEKLKVSDSTSDEDDAIRKYTSSSASINGYLHGVYHNQFNIVDHSKIVNKISGALKKNRTKIASVVYTGVKTSPAAHFDHNTDNVEVPSPGFTSTSSKRSVAASFSRPVSHKNDSATGVSTETGQAHHIIKIHVPAGSEAASVKHLAVNANEHEILLNHGANLRIKRNPTHIGTTKEGHPIYQWEAHLVGHSNKIL